MNAKRKLLEKLIDSLKNECEDWQFHEKIVANEKWGIAIWIGNGSLYNLHIYKPTTLIFSFIGTIRLYTAIDKCKVNSLLSLKNKRAYYEPKN